MFSWCTAIIIQYQYLNAMVSVWYNLDLTAMISSIERKINSCIYINLKFWPKGLKRGRTTQDFLILEPCSSFCSAQWLDWETRRRRRRERQRKYRKGTLAYLSFPHFLFHSMLLFLFFQMRSEIGVGCLEVIHTLPIFSGSNWFWDG